MSFREPPRPGPQGGPGRPGPPHLPGPPHNSGPPQNSGPPRNPGPPYGGPPRGPSPVPQPVPPPVDGVPTTVVDVSGLASASPAADSGRKGRRSKRQKAPKPSGPTEVGFFRTRRGAILRWSALVVGLLLIGGGIGYLVPPRSGGHDNPVTLPSEAFAVDAHGGSMPSVVGLSKVTARAALTTAGVSGDIEFVERGAAGPVGTVLEQKPEAGKTSDGRIQLVVSTPLPMPAVAGKAGDEVRISLENLGAVVAVERVVAPESASGTVLEADPAEGTPIPSVVTLKVADPGDAISLSTVSSVESSSCSTSSSNSVNGTTVQNNVTCRAGSSEASVEYALSRNAALFEAGIGTDDRAGTGTATVRVFADGRLVKTVDTALGKSTDVKVDMRDVLRMKIVVTTRDSDNAPTVVLGDAKLRGSTAGLDQIAGR